jgi:hypothetical protein
MSELKKPLLPKLEDNPRLSFPQAGVWDDRNLPALDDLSSSLKVDRSDIEFAINAIPDVWARPLLFEMALNDEKHLLHKCVLGEWRGLLAMLALRELRGLNITAKPVTISAFNESRQGFESVLAKLVPANVLTPDTTWNNLYVIMFGDQPIGLTSPTTLVCTAADCYNRIHGVSWFDGRYIQDPISELNDLEKRELGGWLVKLNGELAEQPDIHKLENLIRLINEFVEDLVGRDFRSKKLDFKESTASLDMTAGLFRLFNHPIEGKIPADHSHVRLVPSRGKNPTVTLLMVDPNLADYWVMPKQDINIIGAITLASFPFSGLGPAKRGREFGRIKLLENTEWCSPAYFFTDKMFVIAQADALPGADTAIKGFHNMRFQDNAVTPILPINPDILNYLNRGDLSQRINMENTADGFKVKIRLPLSGNGDTPRDFEIGREYRNDGDVIQLDNLPLLEIWPNFETPTWRAYYVYYDTVGRQNTVYAKPAITTKAFKSESFKNSRSELEREISCTDSFPEGFSCEVKLGNNVYSAGMILLKQPETPPAATESWKVGIDFGTSGTNVFAGSEGVEPAQVVFKERLMQVTAPGAARANLYNYFIQDDSERSTAFLSIYHDFQTQPDAQKFLEPILQGHIFFLSKRIEDFKAKNPGMVVDLKWGSSVERLRARAFLEQLCLQASAEAVLNGAKDISWRFSFPTAFSVRDKQDFLGIWNTICANCNAKTGLASSETLPHNMSESVAAAHFFANSDEIKAKLGRGAVCVDIGGGTSDISIWQGSDIRLRWQTSVLYAGRDIFLELIRRKPDILDRFGIGGPETEYLKTIKEAQKAFYAQTDAIINKKGADMLKQLPVMGAEPEVREFVNLMTLGLAGLFHYIGLLLRDLNQMNQYQLRMPNVFVGGNGSQMFNWVAGGNYNSESPVNNLFKTILTLATEFKSTEKFEIQLSPRPKAEVAYGLVKSDLIPMNYKDNLETQGVIAGEDFSTGDEVAINDDLTQVAAASENEPKQTKTKGRKPKSATAKNTASQYTWNTILTTDMILSGIHVSPKLLQLKTFLDRFNQNAEKAGVAVVKYDDQYLLDITDDLNQKLSQWVSKSREKEESVMIEPLFIKGLKTFVEMKADEWAKKYR